MSRSALSCAGCGYRLGWRRVDGKLRVEPDVLVVRFADGRVVVTCPACGELTWRAGLNVWLLPSDLRRAPHAVD